MQTIGEPVEESGAAQPPARLLRETAAVTVQASPADVFGPIQRIGGETGWYYADWLWKLRGTLDGLAGGPGMSRGRRDPNDLRTGDVIDCWRVEVFEPNRRLRLFLEFRQPGNGWLEFEVVPDGSSSTVHLTATYDPGGILGRIYWWLVSPLHQLVFSGMLRRIATLAGSDAPVCPG